MKYEKPAITTYDNKDAREWAISDYNIPEVTNDVNFETMSLCKGGSCACTCGGATGGGKTN